MEKSMRLIRSCWILLLAAAVGWPAATNAASDSPPLVGPDRLSEFWLPEKEAEVRPFQNNAVMCVTVAFRIDEKGRTRDHGALWIHPEDSSWNVDTRINALSRPAINAAKATRFRPADGQDRGTPLVTYRTYAFAKGLHRDEREKVLQDQAALCEAHLAAGAPGFVMFVGQERPKDMLKPPPHLTDADKSSRSWTIKR
jgi:hypothetical protein